MSQKPKSKQIKPNSKAPVKPGKPLNSGFFRRNSFAIGLFLIAFVVFANGIGNEYALDDEFYTAGGNKLTQKGIKGIPTIFTSRTFYNNDGSGYSFRPVALATFAIETQFFGEDPHVSHFFNVLLYALTIVLIFSILRKWFVTQGDWFCFFISLLFIVHPLHTEVVDNIKCRDELLAMLFGLLTIYSIWRHLETKRWIFVLAYPLLFIAGLLSKITVVPFFLLIPIAMWFFVSESQWSWKNEKLKKWICIFIYLLFCVALVFTKKPSGVVIILAATVFLWFANPKFWKIALYIAPLLLIAVVATILQKHNLQEETRTYLAFENPIAYNAKFAEISATASYVMGRYLFLHFIPYPLAYYYGSFYVPIVSWANPIAIASLIIHILIGIWAFKEVRKKSILGFGLLFYLINMIIYSNILRPAPGVMAERYTYASSLGFCIVAVVLIFRFLKINPFEFRWKSEEFKKVRLVIIAVAVLFAARTFWRTGDWESKQTLYSHDMEYLGESVKANMLYGALISKDALQANMQSRVSDGKGGARIDNQKKAEADRLFSEARGYYEKAALLAPYYHTAWSNLGTMYFFTGETRHGLSLFLKAVSIKDDYAEGWFNVGMAYDKLNMKDSAFYSFGKSIKSDSAYIESYDQLSRLIVQEEKNPQKAIALLQRAAKNKPTSEAPWNNMANIYFQIGDTVQSAMASERAAEINPDNVQRLYNLAEYFRRRGDVNKFNYYNSRYIEGRKKMEKKEKEQQEKAQ